MVIVEEIKWLSENGLEAEVTISDEAIKLICFAHPFNGQTGDIVPLPLYAIETTHILISDKNAFFLKRINEGFEYYIIGKVKDKDGQIVCINNIEIELDVPFPGDIKNDEFVSFVCSRLDLMST